MLCSLQSAFSFFPIWFLLQSYKEVIEDTEAQLTLTIYLVNGSDASWTQDLGAFQDTLSGTDITKEVIIAGTGWPEQLNNATGWNSSLWCVIRSNPQETIYWVLWGTVACSLGTWHPEAHRSCPASICLGAHWLHVWDGHGAWPLGILPSVQKSI